MEEDYTDNFYIEYTEEEIADMKNTLETLNTNNMKLNIRIDKVEQSKATKTKHDGVSDQCNNEATKDNNIKEHVITKHDNVIYNCMCT